MIWSEFSALSVQKTLTNLNSRNSGLTAAEAVMRLRSSGPNSIPRRQVEWWHILSRQFTSPFIYLLILAAVVSGLLESLLDASIIMLFVFLNTALGFLQEYRSDRTLKTLQKYLQSHSRVIRSGNIVNIPVQDLVPGDILELEPGDILPADVRFISVTELVIDESVLTGESAPVVKSSSPLSLPAPDLYQAQNIGFSGTSIIKGRARAAVIATGLDSSFGQIVSRAMVSGQISAFETDLSGFGRFVLRLVVITLVFLFVANLVLKGGSVSPVSLLVFSIALAVSVIPEALPVVMTFSLSRGASRLARNKVVVKTLSSIEDLGGIQILCTDKTGTLTENRLTLSDNFSASSVPVTAMALAGVPASSQDPFDITLRENLTDSGRQVLFGLVPVTILPFDPVRRCTSALVRTGRRHLVILRGAPEVVLPLCSALPLGQDSSLRKWTAGANRMGYRLLAVAQKKATASLSLSRPESTPGFELIGLIAFSDRLKSTALQAVKSAGQLGVRIKILTGDSPEVAGAVAAEIGLISQPDQVLTGTELDKLSPDQLAEAVLEFSVFARVNPLQKNEIIDTLQKKYSVGFLGEGINDAVALNSADIGLVVAGAADVARESADIILLEKDLNVIIEGIRIGRTVTSNVGKYIVATLTSNFGNFFALATASLLIKYLPLLPIQILLLNFLSDFPMISIATDNVPDTQLNHPVRFNIRRLMLMAVILGSISTLDDFAFFALFQGISPQVLLTNWFIGSTLTELALLFSIRTSGPFYKGIAPSRPLLYLTVAAAFTAVILPFTPLSRTFSLTPPSAFHLFLIFSLVLIYFFATELAKLALLRHSNNS